MGGGSFIKLFEIITESTGKEDNALNFPDNFSPKFISTSCAA